MLFALAVLLLQGPGIPLTLTFQVDRADAPMVQIESTAARQFSQKASAPDPELSFRSKLQDAAPFMNRASLWTRGDLSKPFGLVEENPAGPALFLRDHVEPQPAGSAGSSALGAYTHGVAVPGESLDYQVKTVTRGTKRLWYVLTVVHHSAATFDAWSTRRIIESGQGYEMNPLMRPFASSNGLYAAVQVGPGLLDYLGRRMMKSQRPWVRRLWWLPQVAGTTASLWSGAHNLRLAVRSTPGLTPQYRQLMGFSRNGTSVK